jgi:hypothetical protein
MYMKDAAEYLHTSHTQIRNYLNKQKPYKGYLIKINDKSHLYKKYLNIGFKIISLFILIILMYLFITNIINFYKEVLENYLNNKIKYNTKYIELSICNKVKKSNVILLPFYINKITNFVNINDT